MVASFPYYPAWKKRDGDWGRLYRTDDFGGVRVYRCWHYVPARVTTLRRMGHEESFGLISLLRVLFLPAADVHVVVSPPLLPGPLASLVGALKRRPYVFHVQDLQPDAAVGLGMVKAGRFTRLLYRIERWSYRHAAAVSGISEGMMAAFTRKGVPAGRRWLSPNCIRTAGHEGDGEDDGRARAERGRRFRDEYQIPHDAFLAAYSGNLGRKQGLECLVEAAALLKAGTRAAADGDDGRELVILMVGDGAMRAALDEQVNRPGAGPVRMLPLLGEEDYQGLLAASGTGQYFLPSKLLSVLAAGVPVVSVADEESELAKAVAEGKFGVNTLPANPAALAATLRSLAAAPERLAQLRQNTRWVERFEASRVLGELERRLRDVAIAPRREGSASAGTAPNSRGWGGLRLSRFGRRPSVAGDGFPPCRFRPFRRRGAGALRGVFVSRKTPAEDLAPR